jgi:long-chain acyl-CoA synthetase
VANIASHLFRSAEAYPDKAALIFGDREMTFTGLRDSVAHTAAGLQKRGLRIGEKVALMLSSSPEFIIFEFAAFALGATVMPINVYYTSSEIETALKSCDIDFLIIQDAFSDRLEGGLLDRLTSLRSVFVVGEGGSRLGHPKIQSASPVLQETESIHALTDRSCDEVALMLQTSATTGRAKGVMLSIANLQANYDCTPEWLGLSIQDRILCALPLYNTFGLNQCINATMVTGATMILLPKFDVVEVLTAMQKYRCTFFPAVPTMLQKVLNSPDAPRFDVTSVKRLLVGAAPVPAPLLRQVYRSMGTDAVVMTGYGLTEACALVSVEYVALDSDGDIRRPKSVGRVMSGMQMKIVREDGSDAPAREVGQIVIKGPNIMKGYYKMPSETQSAILDGWLQTGDLGYADEEQFFYIVDRKKDLIIRGGQNVYPADIEERLYAHPAVAEAAVIGRPDEVLGEVPEAYVAFKPGASASVEELMLLCKAVLAYYKVPKSIHVLTELPKGPTGKILRRNLRPSA